MWTKIKDHEYFISFTEDNGYEIMVTNYVSLWTTFYSDKAFVAQLKCSNEGLELENDNDFRQKGLYLFSNLDQLKKLSIKRDDTGNSLFINMRIMFGYPFIFECKLSKGSEEFYFEKITLPLLKTIDDLRSSQTELRRQLKEKDEVLEEHKRKNDSIIIRHLKRSAFNDEEHMAKHKICEEIFGTTDIPITLIQKHIQNSEKNVKCEPNSMPNTVVVKEERNGMSKVTQDSNVLPPQTHRIKQEPQTPIECSPTLIKCEQEELIKTEKLSSQTFDNNRRKRMKKLNL